jgi:hypothetical protein
MFNIREARILILSDVSKCTNYAELDSQKIEA